MLRPEPAQEKWFKSNHPYIIINLIGLVGGGGGYINHPYIIINHNGLVGWLLLYEEHFGCHDFLIFVKSHIKCISVPT